MRLQFLPYMLRFKEPAGTSRGILTEKITCLLRIFDEADPASFGLGEAAVFPGLSPEADDRYFYKLMELQTNIRLGRPTDIERFPSLQCGLEQAILDFSKGCRGVYHESQFLQGDEEITINGLVWMGNFDEMLIRLKSKLDAGFSCIKLKIGAIDWRKEIELIEYVRREYGPDKVQIRVDANGAFTMDNAIPRLKRLADLEVHSIEQPIRQGSPMLMRFLCEVSPLPIALDEELLGKFTLEQKQETLDAIRPAYIVIKPSLIGGESAANQWITLAEERGIGWWITSSLESNVGLNALAQWVATLDTHMAQGLGTGALYTNNFPTPLKLEGDKLVYDSSKNPDREYFRNLDWRQ